jgi:4-amino-4-deoxy-L-arabinose transferase-like glycosyltransferase
MSVLESLPVHEAENTDSSIIENNQVKEKGRCHVLTDKEACQRGAYQREVICFLALTVFMVLLIRLISLGLYPLMDTTEARYGEMARIMFETGNWVTPMFDYQVPFWGKPPLFAWLSAAGFELFGVNEFAARLPHFLIGIVTIILVGGFAFKQQKIFISTLIQAKVEGKDSAYFQGWLAAMILTTTSVYLLISGAVMTDTALTLAITLSMISFWLAWNTGSKVWGYLFFVGLSLGMLAKGPLTLVLVGISLGLWLLVDRRWMQLHKRLPWVGGSALFLLLSLPWYLLAEYQTPGFLDYFIVGEHIKRFLISHWAGDLYGNAHQFTRGTIWLYLLLASFPWGFVLIAAVLRKYTRTRSGGDAPKIPNGLTLLITASALTPAVFFTFSGNILWTYVLPGLPFLALLAARACPLPDSHVLRRTALASALLVPALGASAAAWVTAHPDSLKTEKYLIGRFESRSGAPARQITYLNSVPFSARFYSAGTVNTASWASVKPLLSALAPSQHRYFAVEKGSPQVHSLLEYQAQPMDQDRRYTLYRVSGTTRHANEAGADKSSPDA